MLSDSTFLSIRHVIKYWQDLFSPNFDRKMFRSPLKKKGPPKS